MSKESEIGHKQSAARIRWHIVDLLQFIGPIESKSMFGGFGVFLDALMFGLIAGNELYLKVDSQTGRIPRTWACKLKATGRTVRNSR